MDDASHVMTHLQALEPTLLEISGPYDPYMDFRPEDISPHDPYMDFSLENMGRTTEKGPL